MTATAIEVRSLTEAPEFRSTDNGSRIVAQGVAIRYGARSTPIRGQFREEFRSAAFARTVGQSDVHAHLEHGGPFLARTGSGTMRLEDSPQALTYEIDLPDTTAGRDAANLLERGDVAGSSIGFRAIPKQVSWSVDADGMALRSIAEAQLFRVDLTTAPYYPDSTAEIALRSLADDLGMEVRSLLEVPDLAAIIAPADGDEQGQQDADDARETPTVVRPSLLSLYA